MLNLICGAVPGTFGAVLYHTHMKTEITQSSPFRYLEGTKYKVYQDGRIYRTAYDKKLPNGSFRHYKMKQVVPRQLQSRKTRKFLDIQQVTMEVDGRRSTIAVAQVVAYAWKNSFDYMFWQYPLVDPKDGDYGNFHPDNLTIIMPDYMDADPDAPQLPLGIGYLEFPDGTKYYVAHRKFDYWMEKKLHIIKNKQARNETDILLVEKSEQVGMPTLVKIEDDPYNLREADDMKSFDKWARYLNQEEGYPFHPLPPGRLRVMITMAD